MSEVAAGAGCSVTFCCGSAVSISATVRASLESGELTAVALPDGDGDVVVVEPPPQPASSSPVATALTTVMPRVMGLPFRARAIA